MIPTPHLNKIKAALKNPKCEQDWPLLKEALELYRKWIEELEKLSSKGEIRVIEMVELLNWYKNNFEVSLIMERGSDFIKRQKGQLKLGNSILEEFFIKLVHPDILSGLGKLDKIYIGPQTAFMSLSFTPRSFRDLGKKPSINIKTKNQDFTIGTMIHYKFSTNKEFSNENTTDGSLLLAVLAAECKINLDKTMFQEASGTANRFKQGCPMARYYILNEYLDMIPEDTRLTSIDNVFLLRHVNRLPYGKRDIVEEVWRQRVDHPIDHKVIWNFVQEIQNFIDVVWYDPEEALIRGSFNP